MTIEEALKNAEFELWNHIIIMENCPKVISLELQEAHMHIRKAMKILQIQRRME
tara:strand:- start:1067 stop:1228 length:162 start_codon:yes stop_codon:yes gene_type:complete